MREVRASFLHFLADNLKPDFVVHNVRRDSNSPSSELLQKNAINVEFSNVDFEVAVTRQLTSIDIIYDEELTAIDVTRKVWQLMSSSFTTPLMSYEDPQSPVPFGGWIFWEPKSLKFRTVKEAHYFRMNCSLDLKYHLPIQPFKL